MLDEVLEVVDPPGQLEVADLRVVDDDKHRRRLVQQFVAPPDLQDVGELGERVRQQVELLDGVNVEPPAAKRGVVRFQLLAEPQSLGLCLDLFERRSGVRGCLDYGEIIASVLMGSSVDARLHRNDEFVGSTQDFGLGTRLLRNGFPVLLPIQQVGTHRVSGRSVARSSKG